MAASARRPLNVEQLAPQQAAAEEAARLEADNWLYCKVLLGLGMCVLLVVASAVFEDHEHECCDQPLAMMLKVLYCTLLAFIFRREIVTHCLCYSASRDGPLRPYRVILFRCVLHSATFFWPFVSGAMLWASKRCSPELLMILGAVTAYYVLMETVVVLRAVCVFVLRRLIERRVVRLPRSMHTVPEELIHDSPDVQYDNALFGDSPGNGTTRHPVQCCICLERFDAQRPIKRTHCRPNPHVFHADCLQGWLQAAPTCPLCRTDLTLSPDGTAPTRAAWAPPVVVAPAPPAVVAPTREAREPPVVVAPAPVLVAPLRSLSPSSDGSRRSWGSSASPPDWSRTVWGSPPPSSSASSSSASSPDWSRRSLRTPPSSSSLSSSSAS